MPGWLKGLVAVTCAAVLVAVAWWGWSEWGAAQDQEAARVAAEQAELLETQENWAILQDECQGKIDAWDGGRRDDLVETFGRYAEEQVERCRRLVKLPDPK